MNAAQKLSPGVVGLCALLHRLLSNGSFPAPFCLCQATAGIFLAFHRGRHGPCHQGCHTPLHSCQLPSLVSPTLSSLASCGCCCSQRSCSSFVDVGREAEIRMERELARNASLGVSIDGPGSFLPVFQIWELRVRGAQVFQNPLPGLQLCFPTHVGKTEEAW